MLDRSQPPHVETKHILQPFTPEIIKLNNNAPCVFIQGPPVSIVKINLVFTAGGKYTKPYIAKLANVLLAEGSQKFPDNALAEELDKYGAYLFSSVNHDFATLTIVTQTQYLADVLPVFFDAAYAPQFEEDVFNAQCKRRHSTLVEAFMQNGALADDKFMPMVFGPEHPYAQLSHPEVYMNVQKNDVVQFHQKYYNSQNAFLMVVGNITDEVRNIVLSVANQHLTKGKAVVKPDFVFKPQPAARAVVTNPHSQQATVNIGTASITKNSPDYIPLKIAITLLGGFFGSRLMQNVREKSGFTYGIYSSLIAFQQKGMIKISSDVKGDKAFEVEQLILENIRDLQNTKVTTAELDRLINFINGNLLNSFDGLFALDSAFLSTYMYGLELDYFTEFSKTVNNYTPEILMEMMNKYLSTDVLSSVIVVPEKVT